LNPSRDSYSAPNPTPRLTTPDVGGKRPEPGSEGSPSSRPAPRSQGTRRVEDPLGCDPKSGRAAGPSPPLLDSYKNNRNSFCGKWSVAGEIEDKGKKYKHVARLGCKCWCCPVCGPRRARRLRHGIIKAATEHCLTRFLTLTLDHSHCTAENSAVYLRECWRKLRTYTKRRYGQTIDFIAVIEFQINGYAHLHVLVDRYIPQPWIKNAWQAIGGGPVVDIRQVDIHRISAYLSKYLTKDIFLSHYPHGTRRYSTSRGIRLFERVKKGLWQLIKNSVDNLRPPSGIPVAEEKRDTDGGLQWFRFQLAVGC